MSRADIAAAAFDEDYAKGVQAAAEELFARLVAKGISDENWNGGDVVEVVDSWLQGHGIDTSEPYGTAEAES